MLTVTEHAGVQKTKGGSKCQLWRCHCECGGEKVSRSNYLVSGRTKSCGCRSHGHKKHGLYEHPLRSTHAAIIQRCENINAPEYKNYGGRGISICAEWRKDLPTFVSYIESIGWVEGCCLTIDRINNFGNYEPGNIRLADKVMQARNTRTNKVVTFRGESKTLAEWADVLGVPYGRIQTRLYRGWPVNRALTEPACK